MQPSSPPRKILCKPGVPSLWRQLPWSGEGAAQVPAQRQRQPISDFYALLPANTTQDGCSNVQLPQTGNMRVLIARVGTRAPAATRRREPRPHPARTGAVEPWLGAKVCQYVLHFLQSPLFRLFLRHTRCSFLSTCTASPTVVEGVETRVRRDLVGDHGVVHLLRCRTGR